MFVLLQIYPLEAVGDDDLTPLDAMAVDGSQERLEEYLVGYQERYCAACAEFAARDPNPSGDWSAEHDCLADTVADRHAVYGCLMLETQFQIVEVLAPTRGPFKFSGRPILVVCQNRLRNHDAAAPRSTSSAMATVPMMIMASVISNIAAALHD